MFGGEPAQYVGYVDGQLEVASGWQVGKFCVSTAAFGDSYGFAYGNDGHRGWTRYAAMVLWFALTAQATWVILNVLTLHRSRRYCRMVSPRPLPSSPPSPSYR